MNIYQKLIEVRKVVPYLQKENSGQQYKYVSSSQVLANVREKMDELQLLLVPSVLAHKVSESAIEQTNDKGQTIKRTITYFTELDIEYTWINAEKPDEQIKTTWYGQGVDIAGEKGVGKALTYAEKNFLLKFFNIATDKDDPDSFQGKHDDKGNKSTDKSNSNSQNQSTSNVKPLSDAQIQRAYTIAKSKCIDENGIKAWIKTAFKKTSIKELTKQEYDQLCTALENSKQAV